MLLTICSKRFYSFLQYAWHAVASSLTFSRDALIMTFCHWNRNTEIRVFFQNHRFRHCLLHSLAIRLSMKKGRESRDIRTNEQGCGESGTVMILHNVALDQWVALSLSLPLSPHSAISENEYIEFKKVKLSLFQTLACCLHVCKRFQLTRYILLVSQTSGNASRMSTFWRLIRKVVVMDTPWNTHSTQTNASTARL